MANSEPDDETTGSQRHRRPLSEVKEEIEDVAAQFVAGQLGGRVCRRDKPGAPDGTHDFDIVLPDDRVVAVEVTSSNDEAIRAERAAIDKNQWIGRSLRYSWALWHAEGQTQVKQLHKEAEGLLRQLEDAGLADFGTPRSAPVTGPVGPAAQRLTELGVHGANRLMAAEPGDALICLESTGGGQLGPAVVNAAVAKQAPPNVDKLIRAGVDETHLWVWADWSDHLLVSSMYLPSLPDIPPDLPVGITTAWVATMVTTQDDHLAVGTVWRVGPDGRWETLAEG